MDSLEWVAFLEGIIVKAEASLKDETSAIFGPNGAKSKPCTQVKKDIAKCRTNIDDTKSSLAEAEAERIDRTEPQQKKQRVEREESYAKRKEEPEVMDRKYESHVNTWLEKVFRDPISKEQRSMSMAHRFLPLFLGGRKLQIPTLRPPFDGTKS